MEDESEFLDLMTTVFCEKKVGGEEKEEENCYKAVVRYTTDPTLYVVSLKSKYQAACDKESTRRIRYRMEKAEKMDMYRIKPSKIAKTLTYIDMNLYRDVSSMELVMYNGVDNAYKKCETLSRFRFKNEALTSFVHGELADKRRFKYLYRVAAELLRLQNYDSFKSVTSGILTLALTEKQLLKVTALMKGCGKEHEARGIFQEKLLLKEFFVPSFDTILKDIQESNCNSENEMASMRFCKAIELLVYVQNLEKSIKVKSKYEHFIIYKMNKSKKKKIESYITDSTKRYAHFLLW